MNSVRGVGRGIRCGLSGGMDGGGLSDLCQ